MSEEEVTLGIIGYPNAGKFTILNSLKFLEKKNVKLIDLPCVCLDDVKSKSENLVRNIVDCENVENPMVVCEEIFNKVSKNNLLI